MFASGNVFHDDRSKKFLKKDAEGELIGFSLLKAIAVTPLRSDEETPVDLIFANAHKIADEENWWEESKKEEW